MAVPSKSTRLVNWLGFGKPGQFSAIITVKSSDKATFLHTSYNHLTSYRQILAEQAFPSLPAKQEEVWLKQFPWFLSPLAFLGLSGCGSKDENAHSPPQVQNNPPEIESLKHRILEVGVESVFSLPVSDPDGDELNVSIRPIPNAEFPLGAFIHRPYQKSHVFHWKPRVNQVGEYRAQIVASDGLLESQKEMGITVLDRPINALAEHDGGVGDGGISIDGWASVSDAAVNSDGGRDSGSFSEGGTDSSYGKEAGSDSSAGKDSMHYCDAPGQGRGEGTLLSPYTFKVLVMVEKGTKEYADMEGWDTNTYISGILSNVNEFFNNGQLSAKYHFESIGTRFPSLDLESDDFPPGVEETPEEEDVILLLDRRFPGNNQYDWTKKTVVMKSIADSNDMRPGWPTVATHELAHFRSAIDMRALSVGDTENGPYPWASYLWPGTSIMGVGITAGNTWDPLNIQLMNRAGGDPKKSFECAFQWLRDWVPETITIEVKNSNGDVVPNSKVDLYRFLYAYGSNYLTEDHLWWSGTTDPQGRLAIPEGLVGSGGFFATYLAAVEYGGESYLNWYNIGDIAVPYRQGVNELILSAKVEEATRYIASDIIYSDLAIQNLGFSPESVPVGGPLIRNLIIKNLGPDKYVGQMGIQFYLSEDPLLDPINDLAFGGFILDVNLDPNGTMEYSDSSMVPLITVPGDQYLLASVDHYLPFSSDPDEGNNFMASPLPIQVSP